MPRSTEKNKQTEQPGLVISYFGNSVAVEAADGQVFQCQLRRNQDLPVVGDKVLWQLAPSGTGTVSQILPRQSWLARGDNRGQSKPIAANVDCMLIVMSPPPIFSAYLVDRYLIAAELLGIHPILVLNKVDLLDESAKERALELLRPYASVPYPVVLSSVCRQDGLDELMAALTNKTAVLVGPSGVGKSSIIGALGVHEIKVGEVSAKGAGRHTTTATRLYHLPNGANLIDSPGVREFNLWPVTTQEVWQGFREFHLYQDCRFRDCQHLAEPGCAVQAAVAGGNISPDRYASYQMLMKEAAAHKKYE
jgi:ribosome biogenesis GTPase